MEGSRRRKKPALKSSLSSNQQWIVDRYIDFCILKLKERYLDRSRTKSDRVTKSELTDRNLESDRKPERKI